MSNSIGEIKAMTESEKRYRIWERLEDMNIRNPIEPSKQWENVLLAKWGMLANSGGSL